MQVSTNTGDSQRRAGSGRRPALACAVFVMGVAMCAWGERHTDAFGREIYYPDPEFCEIAEQKRSLEQDGLYIIYRDIELCDLKIRVLQTLQIIEALSGLPAQQAQEELARQRQRLKDQKGVIGEKIKFLDQLDRMLESDRKRLADRETRYEDAIRAGKAPGINGKRDFWCRVHKCNHTSPSQRNQDYRQHQNDLVRAQTDESTRQFALAKLGEMQMRVGRLEQSTFSIIASQRLPPPVPAPLHDVEELKLCEALDKKVTAPDYDIAEINLLAAKGLPGAENLDVEKSLKTLDQWAAWVRRETDRSFHKFKDAPAEYNNSEAYFRILMMVCILQEDAKERFNIEGTSRGLNCFPDKEYMEWPWPISKEEVETGMYMKSLSPRRELAAFLETRALCLKQHTREKQFLTAKVYADCLRRKEGVDLDKVNRLLRLSNQKACAMAFSGSNQVVQTVTSTNSWRAMENERGKPGIPSVFAVERLDPK